MGLIGTDAFCAERIATEAAARAGAYVAPVVSYAPAPFNTGFPGTVSVSEPVYRALLADILSGLHAQGFDRIYVLNAHGANLAPLRGDRGGHAGRRDPHPQLVGFRAGERAARPAFR